LNFDLDLSKVNFCDAEHVCQIWKFYEIVLGERGK